MKHISQKQKEEAKELSLRVWTLLRDNPHLETKRQLPLELRNELRSHICECPLCTLYLKHTGCKGCPLNSNKETLSCMKDESAYRRWGDTQSSEIEIRKEAASKIVDAIQKWKTSFFGRNS